jgi:hypothetical protein
VDPAFRPDLSRRLNENWAPKSETITRVLKHPTLRRVALAAFPSSLQQTIRGVTGRNAGPAPVLDPALREELTEQYREDIECNADLIGQDLSLWLQPDRKG